MDMKMNMKKHEKYVRRLEELKIYFKNLSSLHSIKDDFFDLLSLLEQSITES
jgi:hypothetical protein